MSFGSDLLNMIFAEIGTPRGGGNYYLYTLIRDDQRRIREQEIAKRKSTEPRKGVNIPQREHIYGYQSAQEREDYKWKMLEENRIQWEEAQKAPKKENFNDDRALYNRAIDKLIAKGSTNKYVLAEIERRKEIKERRKFRQEQEAKNN